MRSEKAAKRRFEDHHNLTRSHANMSAFTVTASVAARAAAPAVARRSVVARAGGYTPDKTVGKEVPVVFYTDKDGVAQRGSVEEYMAAKESGNTYRASTVTGVLPEWAAGATADSNLQFTTAQAFAFTGPEGSNFIASGPELMNGRLAMIAFLAAAPAEITTGEPVSQQFADAPFAVLLTVAMIVAGSLISFQANAMPNPVGPFTKEKELLNGRAAMVGMAALIGIEAVKHTALL